MVDTLNNLLSDVVDCQLIKTVEMDSDQLLQQSAMNCDSHIFIYFPSSLFDLRLLNLTNVSLRIWWIRCLAGTPSRKIPKLLRDAALREQNQLNVGL